MLGDRGEGRGNGRRRKRVEEGTYLKEGEENGRVGRRDAGRGRQEGKGKERSRE